MNLKNNLCARFVPFLVLPIPLLFASILGAASSLETYHAVLDDEGRNEMLHTIQEEAERLNRFVANLLDMTRLESGAIELNLGVADLGEVVGSAIGRAGKVLAGHRVQLELGPRLPLLVISPYAKPNFVDHSITDQSSITRFVEDNWLNGERIQGSFDAIAGPLDNMFNFEAAPNTATLMLSESSGQPINPAQSASPKTALHSHPVKPAEGTR